MVAYRTLNPEYTGAGRGQRVCCSPPLRLCLFHLSCVPRRCFNPTYPLSLPLSLLSFRKAFLHLSLSLLLLTGSEDRSGTEYMQVSTSLVFVSYSHYSCIEVLFYLNLTATFPVGINPPAARIPWSV